MKWRHGESPKDRAGARRSLEELAKLLERQRKQQENIDWLNAQAPRPATWTIGKELGELPLVIGIVNAIGE